MKKYLQGAGCFGSAMLIALSLGMDLAPARAARPQAIDLFGYVYQLIARTFASIALDRLALAAVAVAALWLCRRFLFHKPEKTGAGEYVLCAFLGLMMLLATAVRTQGTVQILWTNAFQLAKTLLCAAGMYLLFLVLLRGLRQVCTALPAGCCSRLYSLEHYLSLWKLFLILTVAWLPHIIARYPGVLMWDSYMQIKQFMGEGERWANHPPFGTLLYGAVAWLGECVGNRNLIYFLFTLFQCGCYLAVLSYSLVVLRRLGMPAVLWVGTLAVYAVSPCYAGWATVIAKDSSYVILYILLVTLMLEVMYDRKRFFRTPVRLAVWGIATVFLTLCRHNGAAIALAGLVCVAGVHWKAARRHVIRLTACSLAALALAFGAETLIQKTMNIRDLYIPDVMSLPFQQTARVVKLHAEDISAQDAEIIDRVVDYAGLAEHYVEDYADQVKDTYRQSATPADRAAYWGVWFRHLLQWPADYLDAMLCMNGVLFDLRDNAPMYVCFSDAAINEVVYPWSFNDMTMYEREALVPLNSLNRTLTEWYMDFDQIPLIGLVGSMSFHALLMLGMCYISWTSGRRRSLLIWVPNLVTWGICLAAPVVYLRYALPFICAAPLCLAAYFAERRVDEL